MRGACEHSFPLATPGAFGSAGPCEGCGKTRERVQAEEALREAVAAMNATEPERPEIRTCYCGMTATVMPGVFPHSDCDGSVLAAGAERELADLRRKVAEYENAIGWNTSCVACARVLDSAVSETFRREEAERRLEAADRIFRDALEALCRRDGLPLDSTVTPGEPARNYELAERLGIGHVFGLPPQPAVPDAPKSAPGQGDDVPDVVRDLGRALGASGWAKVPDAGLAGTQGEGAQEARRAAFSEFLASQGFDDDSIFGSEDMGLAFETGWQIARAAPAAAESPGIAVDARQLVAAERARIRDLADRTGAVCTGREGTSFHFSALLADPEVEPS